MNHATFSPRYSFRYVTIAIVVVLAIWMVTVGLMSYEPSIEGIDVVAGYRVFRANCGSCHMIEKGISTHHGPNLYGFGKLAGTRRPELTAAEYILQSIVDPDVFVADVNRRGMPRNLATVMTPEEIRNVVAYVVSRGGSPDYTEIHALDIPDLSRETESRTVRREDMELAEQVLRGRSGCLQCHTLYRNAEYTVFAPALFGAGLSDETLLRESIVDPSKAVSPYHRWVNVYLANGKTVTGKLIERTEERLVLLERGDANDLVQVDIPMSDIEVEDDEVLILESETSPMPTGLDKILTEHELDVLVRMVRQLN